MERRIDGHPLELERDKIEEWLVGFLPKLKRSTTRTQKCRLISAVERMDFEKDSNAYFCSIFRSNLARFAHSLTRLSIFVVLRISKFNAYFTPFDFAMGQIEYEKLYLLPEASLSFQRRR